MPEKYFSLPMFLAVVTGFLLIQIVTAKIGRRQKNRRLEREITEYLRKKAAGQNS